MSCAQRYVLQVVTLFILFMGSFLASYYAPIVSADSLGDRIICGIFENLSTQGLPIPAGLDSTGCDSDGGGSGEPPVSPGTTQCSNWIDDDADGKIDYLPGTSLGDSDCDSLGDDSEASGSGGGGVNNGGGSDNGSGGGGSGGGGNSSGGSTDSVGASGGSAGSLPACGDSQDNDGDTHIDSMDPGCSNSLDSDESNTPPFATTTPLVATSTDALATTTTVSCEAYITAFMRSGTLNDSEQVTRLQAILQDEGMSIGEQGSYDQKTVAGVKAFQNKYEDEILKPWGITVPTGNVYLTTRKKLNELHCKSLREFALTEVESTEIQAYRSRITSRQNLQQPEKSVTIPTKETEPEIRSVDTQTVGGVDVESQVATVGSEEVEKPLSKLLKPVRSFMSRLFGRDE